VLGSGRAGSLGDVDRHVHEDFLVAQGDRDRGGDRVGECRFPLGGDQHDPGAAQRGHLGRDRRWRPVGGDDEPLREGLVDEPHRAATMSPNSVSGSYP
jgi:hypothetical protein